MSLDTIIAPEIRGDRFATALTRMASDKRVGTILEIGASSGDGSTAALLEGGRKNPRCPQIYCLEASRGRFTELVKRYAGETSVHAYNLSSVKIEDFPPPSEVLSFMREVPGNKLRKFGETAVLSWLKQDIDYAKTVGSGGIEFIKSKHLLNVFDAVLIDGSEFLGWKELELVRGALFLALDDVTTFKNHRSYTTLKSDPAYRLIEQDLNLRHGYAIFERIL